MNEKSKNHNNNAFPACIAYISVRLSDLLHTAAKLHDDWKISSIFYLEKAADEQAGVRSHKY